MNTLLNLVEPSEHKLHIKLPTLAWLPDYNLTMERKIFWMVFFLLGLLADFVLPFWWAFAATIPILFIAWWVAYRSDWF